MPGRFTVCDTLSGSKHNGALIFIEFENASATSLFRRVAGRRVSRCGARFEAGLSQVTDWLFRLDCARNWSEMERDFGIRQRRPLGLVVADRRSKVTPYDERAYFRLVEDSREGGWRQVIYWWS